MPYTNNVPQGNQTIAQTTDPIRNNFAFIQTDLQVEHQFNGNVVGLAEGMHIRASMPNTADPSLTLPAGVSGVYYVSNDVPKFANSFANAFIQITNIPYRIISGTVNLSSSGSPTPVFTLPEFSYGYYFIGPTQSSGKEAVSASATGSVVSTSITMQIGPTIDPGIDITLGGIRTLNAKLTSSSNNGLYNYIVIYYTPPTA